jgi:hypothetical protein
VTWPLLWSKWSEFLAANPQVPGSVPDSARFSRVAVVLERGSLSLVRISEEELERKSSGFGLEN